MVVIFLDAKVRHIIEFCQFLSIHILHIHKNTGGGILLIFSRLRYMIHILHERTIYEYIT